MRFIIWLTNQIHGSHADNDFISDVSDIVWAGVKFLFMVGLLLGIIAGITRWVMFAASW